MICGVRAPTRLKTAPRHPAEIRLIRGRAHRRARRCWLERGEMTAIEAIDAMLTEELTLA